MPSINTNLSLPQLPLANPIVPTYQDLLNLYNALWTLAQQIDTILTLTEDVRFSASGRGIILKDTQATPHYWRVTVNNVGGLVTTDLGTSLP